MNIPVFRVDPTLPRNVFSLNGEWEFQPGGAGTPQGPWPQRIRVPGLVDLAAPPHPWREHPYHWYRKAFTVDSPSKPDTAILTIEQAMFGTEVWLNGRRIGGDIACYTSQEYDVGDHLIAGKANELLVRVGARETLPPESAVGNDQERTDFVPGLWGDVHLALCGNPRIKRVGIVPNIDAKTAGVTVAIANGSARNAVVSLRCALHDRNSGADVLATVETSAVVPPGHETAVTMTMPVPNARLWSPDDPFLYRLESLLTVGTAPVDALRMVFGMREFRISGPDFLLNGRKIRLRGGNIAFHRFLSDADRSTLPWDPAWIKKILIDIPKAHNFNFFRNHLGQMYNRWYDIADEYGMLLQNEWAFWTTSGTKEQITSEFTRWLHDNGNHPSIVIWDALNECSDAVVSDEIVPEMKKIDPTRPWEPVDFTEQHPYIYSLGPVLVDRKLGFTEPLEAIENSVTPSVVNEFLWWWLDSEFNPTVLTRQVIERWLGPQWTQEELVERQSFLAGELVELFRRMDVKAIQPFVYLSNNAGPTGNWFTGNIAAARPKPLMAALKNAFAPFGVSIELWDRHFVTGEERTMRLFVFNDDQTPRGGKLRFGVCAGDGTWLARSEESVGIGACSTEVRSVSVRFPQEPGTFWVTAELAGGDGEAAAVSRKIAHVVDPPRADDRLRRKRLAVFDRGGEMARYLRSAGAEPEHSLSPDLSNSDVVVIAEGLVRVPEFRSQVGRIGQFVESGKTLVILEPELGVAGKETVFLTGTVTLSMEPRNDLDKGGYDSYVFAESASHPLWDGIPAAHLRMFNGGYGGEVVSEHRVEANVPSVIHARCGLALGIPAVFEVAAGRGKIIVSRLQLRRRLLRSTGAEGLYGRRPDPVLQRFLMNLLAYASA